MHRPDVEAIMKKLSILFTLLATFVALGCGGGNPRNPGPGYKAVAAAR